MTLAPRGSRVTSPTTTGTGGSDRLGRQGGVAQFFLDLASDALTTGPQAAGDEDALERGEGELEGEGEQGDEQAAHEDLGVVLGGEADGDELAEATAVDVRGEGGG